MVHIDIATYILVLIYVSCHDLSNTKISLFSILLLCGGNDEDADGSGFCPTICGQNGYCCSKEKLGQNGHCLEAAIQALKNITWPKSSLN